ncbi:MAG: NAD-dependent epimerase [Planctomycetes bacterium]|nr:NAD-dependent epimerase [Planctomycetota bacterium]
MPDPVQPVLVTGAAGFIGYHVCRALLGRGTAVVGIDNLSPYYDPALKRARVAQLAALPGFTFRELDIADRPGMAAEFAHSGCRRVVHLAAQAGVRHSLTDPHSYVDANLVGFMNILEGSRQHGITHLVYASSSSVYGLSTALPFSVHDHVDHPLSLYAATKKANELMAHSYSHLYQLPATGLRFFSVYGPWGRPDMALFKFTRAILAGEPIEVYNHGRMVRDFTYVDDIAEAVVRVLARPPAADPGWDTARCDPASSSAPWRVYNVGNHQPVELNAYIAALEHELGRRAELTMLPMQLGDVPVSSADVSDLVRDIGWCPATPIATGVARFVAWYRSYYGRDGLAHGAGGPR